VTASLASRTAVMFMSRRGMVQNYFAPFAAVLERKGTGLK